MDCVIDRPIPEPCGLPDTIGKKILSLRSAGIPGPLSSTRRRMAEVTKPVSGSCFLIALVLNEKLNDTLYEVILKLGVTVKTDDDVAFLVEIQQAGVFVLQGFDEQTIEHILGSMCPNILFPYARETIDSLAVKASFPAPMLAPIDFEAFMEQRKKPETN